MAALRIGKVYAVVLAVVVMAALHLVLGLVSICVGVVSSVRAEVWLAHTVSPIWSGAFFTFTGILGFACAKRKTAYLIMCFTAFSIVSLVVSVVSIQLLRLGLVNHTTDGETYQKEEKDVFILVALGDAGVEILVCVLSSFVSCRMAKAAKKELFQKRASMFHVQARLERRYGGTSPGMDYYESEDTGVTSRYLDDGLANPAPEMPYQDTCGGDEMATSYMYGDSRTVHIDSWGHEDGAYKWTRDVTSSEQNDDTFGKF